jgi:hypothetical protein
MLPASYQMPAAIVLIAGGALACFLGYRLFRIVLGIYGFILGALIATSVLGPTESSITLLTALVGGVVGAAILILAYFVGVAFAGAALAALLVHVGWSYLGKEPHALVVIGACIIGALAAMSLQRYVIVLGTAFGGAWTLLAGAIALTSQRAALAKPTTADQWFAYPLNPLPGHWWVQIAWLALGIAGTAVQLRGPGPKMKVARVKSRKVRSA